MGEPEQLCQTFGMHAGLLMRVGLNGTGQIGRLVPHPAGYFGRPPGWLYPASYESSEADPGLRMRSPQASGREPTPIGESVMSLPGNHPRPAWLAHKPGRPVREVSGLGRGRAAVVVRARESRVHGEGQQVSGLWQSSTQVAPQG